jgi:hypothetical protein
MFNGHKSGWELQLQLHFQLPSLPGLAGVCVLLPFGCICLSGFHQKHAAIPPIPAHTRQGLGILFWLLVCCALGRLTHRDRVLKDNQNGLDAKAE